MASAQTLNGDLGSEPTLPSPRIRNSVLTESDELEARIDALAEVDLQRPLPDVALALTEEPM